MKFNFRLTMLVIILVAAGLFFYFWKPILNEKDLFTDSELRECPMKIEEKIVRGDSLSGLIESGETVKIAFGFYDCNEIQREDIVIYKFSGNPEPIIKIVKGLQGDKIDLKKDGATWNILINNELVKNSNDEPYQLSESSYNLLNLYVKDYQGVIPPNAYLILGNLAEGSLDSSRFGLVDKSDILGKVAI